MIRAVPLPPDAIRRPSARNDNFLRTREGRVAEGGEMEAADWRVTVLVLVLRIVLTILEMKKARRRGDEPTSLS